MMKHNSKLSVCRSGNSMHFWGVCCVSGKQYAQVVGRRFRITMAVLDPNSVDDDGSESMVSLMVNRNGIEYLLCVLKHEKIQQVNLNLIFDEGENVRFYTVGHGNVCLSGYQLTDSVEDVLNDEIGYLCPLVEIKSESRKSIKGKNPMLVSEFNTSTGKGNDLEVSTIGRPLWHSLLTDLNAVDDDSDEDYFVTDEKECISDSDDGEEEEDDDDEEEDDDDDEVEDDDDEVEDDDDEVEDDDEEEDSSDGNEEKEIIQNIKESRKRKQKVEIPPQKRSKNVSFKITPEDSLENAEDVICIEDTESNDKDACLQMNSAVSSTPVPEKRIINETVSSKKKSKKKKRKSETSNISEVSKNEHTKSPTAASNSKSIIPIVKLNGGVEIQDYTVGKGPEAKIGKMLHVFYVGRLPDKSIFDSRLPTKKPFSFKLGTNQVIKGWDIGLVGMKVGGKRKIRVPAEMAYGKVGNDCIPPNTALNFVVELNSVS